MLDPREQDGFLALARQVPGLVVEAELARGGTAAVFRARDARGAPLALKLQLTGKANQRERLLREVGVMTRLEHPHVVRVLAAGEVSGHVWMALELVEGGTLEALVKGQGPLPPRGAAELVRKLALAVEHVHERGALHRDLKPSNVLIDARGEPRLTDFGLALDLEAGGPERLTADGALLGTPGFWAPELASGQLERISRATDVYGLGALLYWALAGRPPLGGGSLAEVVVTTLKAVPDPPSKHVPSVPGELDAIALRCLAKQPGERWGSARELAQALARWLAVGDAAHTRPLAPRDRRPLLVGLGLGGLLAAGTLVAGRLGAFGPVAPPPVATPTSSAPLPPKPPDRPPPPRRPPRPGAESEARALFEQAWYLVKTEPARAQAMLDQVLALDPDLVDAWNSRGVARDLQGNAAGAEADFERCVALEPLHAKGWTNLGSSQRNRGREDDAQACYRRAIEADPTYTTAWALRGALHWRRGMLSEALADLNQALALEPSQVGALADRAAVRLSLGDSAGALADARRSLELGPRAGTHRIESQALLVLNRPAEGLAAAEAALRLAPDEVIGLIQRARAQAHLGRPESARADLDRALSLNPRHVDARLELAALRERQRDLAGSLEDLEQVLPLMEPDHPRRAGVERAIAGLRAELGR